MSDRNRVRTVRAVLALLMTVMGGMMLAGCPVSAQPPLAPRAADTVIVPGSVPGS
ncbi:MULTISPECIES: hypothetical protein [Mycobacterium]|uniref:hypothetical protein n=1 Tax=Mycobacterium TaxID=1763 RepID=UPI000A581E0C|nr:MULTISPECIES: hypothetical protein [Mycobacterium]MDP7728024.1 hypothetical protein [Mycobacterium sp. TY813]